MINTENYKKFIKYFPKYLQKRLPREVAVIEISSKESRRLNRLYRKKDKPTNVLSFRYGLEYGEILVCPAVIKKEAESVGNPQQFQMTRMVIHAMLHLGGLHHETSRKTAEIFENLEQKILTKLNKRVK